MAEQTIGILAESENDCKVMGTLVRRILAEAQVDLRYCNIIHRAGSGCAGLRQRAERWLRELSARGCRIVILMHDRDRHDERELRKKLSAYQVPSSVEYHVCIPVEEIEAWFFSCEKALQFICGDRELPQELPHLVRDPKERLIEASRAVPGRPRYSPNDGARIAEVLQLDVCAKRCPAFREMRLFLQKLWKDAHRGQ